MVRLHGIHKTHPHIARELAEQLYDNCLMSAGLLEDPRAMLARINRLLMYTADAAIKGGDAKEVKDAVKDVVKDSKFKLF